MAELPLVAILRGISSDEAEPVGEVLVATGFRLIEVPLTSPDPFLSIERLVRRFGKTAIIGAGTVRTVAQLDRLMSVGGQLVVTPHVDSGLIRAAKSRGLATLPGVATPTEAFFATDAGADALKLYPAEMISPPSVAAFRTVLGPTVRLMPTGGITSTSMARYRQAGASGFGLGGALYRPGDTAEAVREKAIALVEGWSRSG